MLCVYTVIYGGFVRAWVAQRREGGQLLSEPDSVVAWPAPLELLVLDVTDQGRRRPTKVARLFAEGSRVAVAELVAPHLVWFKGGKFVLSGTQVYTAERGNLSAHQSWMCKLDLPPYMVGYRARFQFENGIALPPRQVADRYATVTRGELLINSAMDEALGRHTTRAQLRRHGDVKCLVECGLDFMSADTFQLSGFEDRPACEQWPARLLRQGWLCEYDVEPPPVAASSRAHALMSQR